MLDLNTIVVISLAVLAVFSLVLILILVPLALQFSKALGSLQSLLDIINNDVSPAVKEIKQSVYGVKDALKKGSSVFQDNVNEASILVASTAHGVLTGVKEYLSVSKTEEKSYNSNGNSKINQE